MVEHGLPAVSMVGDLRLRPPVEADREQMLDILNSTDDIAKWTTIPFPYSDDDFDKFLGSAEHRYVIEQHGVILGGIGARPDWDSHTALIGYWLAPHGRGRGVLTSVARAVCGQLFELGIQRIVAEVMVGNLASGRLLDRLGFTLEGVARSVHAPRCGLSEGRIDEQIWSLLPGELAPG
ncbi:MAG: GNAT family N-acetyltransferase [Acidimicrobiales bacterium]|nr:GNAT family N-acetyltransferase [Acidimicrobiales bacterium]